ncbi:MAG: hypothetical protein ACUVWV_15015 [Thermodesulfobacteriota bacterium]
MRKILIVLGFLTLASPLWAADVGVQISIGAPGFYLSVGNFFGYPEREVIIIRERGIPDDELPVVFFICRHAHVPPEVIIELRVHRGWSWSRICAYYRIPPVVFYIPVEVYERPYGPYYRHYHYYRHKNDWERIRLTDAMIVNQVNLIFVSKYYNYPPERIIRMREEGASFANIERKVYREREYRLRGGVPPHEMRRPAPPSPPEKHDPQRWREDPARGVRPPEARFHDVYPSIPHPSHRPDVKGRYRIDEVRERARRR